MELRQLQYFTVIFEEGSVTKAAQRLNVVQPALSQQVSKLEEEIGSQLFFRTPKGMVPTETGKEAYQLFSVVLRDLELARQKLDDNKGVVRGSVSLGVVSSVANNALGETLKSYNAKYPDVRVRTTGGYTTELTEMLRTSQLDLVVVNVPPHLKDPNIVDIVNENLALICATETKAIFEGPVDLETINKLKLVIPSQRHGLRLIMDRAAEEANLSFDPMMEFDDLKPIEDFVRATDFFTVLPPIAVHRALRLGHLKAFPILPEIPRRLVYMTHPARPLSIAAQLLATEIREQMIDFSYDITATLVEDKKLTET